MTPKIENQIYAGVLGKCLGVYLGRPVEGWSYERIRDTFGEITYFVNDRLNLPVVLPDDDISGTFGFFRALEEHGYPSDLTAEQVGKTWLNTIIEEKTILWWGGLGRSTEHTAFLRLKAGIPAPASGSHKLNGAWLPAQIGAQIFMDGFALAAQNDPDLAAHLVRSAASVSHDGLAVDAAVLLGVMESLAFSERNIDKLLDVGLEYVSDRNLLSVINLTRRQCAATDDWHTVRNWIAANHGYDHYDGPCHMVPNHLVVLMALLMAGDDFSRSISIATSAGWDTDCNAGNVGCLNGVRLGLKSIDDGTDLRSTMADRMYVVTSDGGEGVTDAVRETRKIIRAAKALKGEGRTARQPRYGFEYPGSTQGFEPCASVKGRQAVLSVENVDDESGGLRLLCQGLGQGLNGYVSTPVFVDPSAAQSSFAMIASPTLYSGQTIRIEAEPQPWVQLRPYVLYYDLEDKIARLEGPWSDLDQNGKVVWEVPDMGGCPCYKLGLEFQSSKRFNGALVVRSIDWSGAPAEFKMQGSLIRSIWNLTPFWTRAWVSSAKHFAPDFKHTFCVSHPGENGVITTGTRDWTDYTVTSELDFSIFKSGGLVIRATGHKRYIAGLIEGDDALIVRQFDDERTVLSRVPMPPATNLLRRMVLSAHGDTIRLFIDGVSAGYATDQNLSEGGAGFVINEGTMVAEGFRVARITSDASEAAG